MTFHWIAVWVLPAALGLPLAAGGEPQRFVVDGSRSRLAVEVEPAGLAGRFGLLHGHVFVATDVRGSLRFDPESPEAVDAIVMADATTLDNEQDALSASDRRTVMRQVRELLEVDEHPWLSLRVQRFEVDEESESSWTGTLQGTLSLAGERRRVEIPVEATLDGSTLEAEGTFRFRASRFGIEPDARLFGAIDVEDEVTLRYELTARRGHARD